MIRKRSEHGFGHLLNPLNPDLDNRDWITEAHQLLIDDPQAILEGGGPAWLDLPALTKLALTSSATARAFDTYNSGRPWREQIKPFNFLLHAHIAPFGYPTGTDPARFRLIAPYSNNPDSWLELLWTDIHTGTPYPVTTDPENHNADVARLKTYRDVLALYSIHPEPKTLDPYGHPCSRRSPPGLLSRRPVTMLTLSLIGKESNRLEETSAGLISTDHTLTSYQSPDQNAWTTLVLPALDDFSNRDLASLAGLDIRTIQRIKKRAINTPHQHNRATITLIAARLAGERLQASGITPPQSPLEQLATYLDHGDTHASACTICGAPLIGRQRRYCGDACKKSAYRARRAGTVAGNV